MGAVFLWVALRDTSLSAIAEALSRGNPLFVIPLLGMYYLQLRIKAWRWALLISPVHATTGKRVFPAVVVGAMSGLFLPAYLGEFARTYVLCRQFDLRYSGVLATVVAERLFDLATVLVFLGILLLLAAQRLPEFAAVGYAIGAMTAILVVAVVPFLIRPDLLRRLVDVISSRWSRQVRSTIFEQLDSAVGGLAALKAPGLLAKVFVLSILQWLTMGLCTYCAILAFEMAAPIQAAFTVLILTIAGMSLPSAPGFFGTIQACFALGLKPYGVPPEAAFAASIYFHVALYLSTLGLGLFYLRKIGYTLRGFKHAVESERAVSSAARGEVEAMPDSAPKRRLNELR